MIDPGHDDQYRGHRRARHLCRRRYRAGLALGARSLSAAAARLPQVEPSAPTHVIGRNTREAMRSGVVLGEVARIDGMLDMVLAEMRATKAAGEGSVPIVITGDDARGACGAGRP